MHKARSQKDVIVFMLWLTMTTVVSPLTMSRMDRLYGVTMAERGVSQLVSVDLQRAETLIAAE